MEANNYNWSYLESVPDAAFVEKGEMLPVSIVVAAALHGHGNNHKRLCSLSADVHGVLACRHTMRRSHVRLLQP
jgi:hypothetical protein